MEKRICVICGKPIPESEFGGCNASPVKEGFCCQDCNDKYVIPARVGYPVKKLSNS